MPVEYAYRCDGCEASHLATAAEKNIYGSSNGSRLDVPCSTSQCRGTLRRVWGAAVNLATVPGTYASTKPRHSGRGSEDDSTR